MKVSGLRVLLAPLAVAALVSCPDPNPPVCGAGTCQGCCDSTGACVGGDTANTCGVSGGACVACLPGQMCQSGACVASQPDGGGCGPASCSGCCEGQSCLAGTGSPACGANGQACIACTSAQHCGGAGTCLSNSGCNGCFDATSTCRPGNTNLACGTGGETCQLCGTGAACQGGACHGGATDAGTDAGPGTDSGSPDAGSTDAGGPDAGSTCGVCAGCCSGANCIPYVSQSISACGTGAAACGSCGGSLSCINGTCAPCTGEACRASDGSCVAPTNSTCGQNGNPCVDCTQQIIAVDCGWSTKSCSIGGLQGIGSSCAADSQCFPGNNLNAPYCRSLWPEGYCEDLCDTAGNQIGSCTFPNSYCQRVTPLDGGDWAGVCLRGCTSASDCGHDAGIYLCDGPIFSTFCVPACNAPSDCQSWLNDPRAGCITATHQCCGLKHSACCNGVCFDGTSCSSGYCT